MKTWQRYREEFYDPGEAGDWSYAGRARGQREPTIKSKYDKCGTCGRWVTQDSQRGQIDIHGKPHGHKPAGSRTEERDGQQVLIKIYPPAK